MDPVVHFEMPYQDKARMASFYTNAFGWKANMLGAEMGEYVMMHTTETDSHNMVQTPGHINGGFFKKSRDSQNTSVVIAVKDIRASMKKIEELGGKIIGAQKPGEPDDIPGIGLYITIEDSEGNKVGMLQPKGM